MVLRDAQGSAQQAALGSFSFSSEGLGVTPGNPLSLIQASESPPEAQMLSQWFDMQWVTLKEHPQAKADLIAAVKSLSAHREATSVYAVYEHVVYDSTVERDFAKALERNEAIKVYAKLPGWFKVPTPLGTYNPDWAVLVERDGQERLYFVVETKSSLFDDDLRDLESGKIKCGAAHFRALAMGENPVIYGKFRDVDGLLNSERTLSP